MGIGCSRGSIDITRSDGTIVDIERRRRGPGNSSKNTAVASQVKKIILDLVIRSEISNGWCVNAYLLFSRSVVTDTSRNGRSSWLYRSRLSAVDAHLHGLNIVGKSDVLRGALP